MDVLVRDKKTGEVFEMSEYSFNLLKDQYELAPKPANQRPIIEPKVFKAEDIKISDGLLTVSKVEVPIPEIKKDLTHDQLVAKFQEVFGKKPGNMKDETILERIKEETKFVVSNTGE